MTERIGDLFLEQTKYRNLEPSDQEKKLPQPPLFRHYQEGERFDLPQPDGLRFDRLSLQDAIEKRRSVRTYAETPFSLDQLSYLLWATQGVKPESTKRFTLRTVPSAGARHPFETLVLVNRVNALDPGLYQFDADKHALVRWHTAPDIASRLTKACLGQPMIGNAAATLIWVADRYRMAWRYGERGLRYLYLDAGHVCQNAYLAAESFGAGACAIGAFFDDQVNELLGLDGSDHFAVYLAAVGIKAEP